MKGKRIVAMILAFILCVGSMPMSGIITKAASKKYWIKVNKQANVATVYQKKNGSWEPIKAMLTSCGGSHTPTGTYNTKAKYRWHELIGSCYGQYCTRIVGGILFHSVWYYNNYDKQAQAVKEFNKLGKTASHGCVRMSTEDCKWVYDNCSIGTKVTIYKSSNPGPLGKPAGYKMPSSAGKMNWDPTDKSSKNPYYQTCPVVKKKTGTITYGDSTYKTAKSLVQAKQKNGKSLKSLEITVKKYDTSEKKYVEGTYSNTDPGKYQISYKATGTKGVYITKTYKFVVEKDMAKPTITLTKDSDQIILNAINASQWLKSAKMQDGTSRKSATKVYVKEPGNDSYNAAMTYAEAKEYVFDQVGTYTIKYTATNKNKTSVKASKTLKVMVSEPEPEIPTESTTESTEIPTEPTTESTETTTQATTESTEASTEATTEVSTGSTEMTDDTVH